jgi:hypothetical protein
VFLALPSRAENSKYADISALGDFSSGNYSSPT